MMNRKKEHYMRSQSALWFMSLFILAAIFIMGAQGSVQAQWATNGNDINSTNTGNVGVGQPQNTGPETKLDVAGDARARNFFGPQQTAFTLGTDRLIASSPTGGAAMQLYGTVGAGGVTNQLRFMVGSPLRLVMMINDSGRIGVGTAAPNAQLDLYTWEKTTRIRLSGQESYETGYYSADGIDIRLGVNRTRERQIWFSDSANVDGDAQIRMRFKGSFASLDSITNDGRGTAPLVLQGIGGNVGIGVTNPQEALDVQGNINVSGNINAKYRDVAEWVKSSQKLSAGTVVILDPEKTDQVIASREPYDTRVAGVVSENPGLVLGEGGEGKVKVATTGRVRVRVDASRAPIKIGDLLVTSDKEGVAMKSEPIVMQGRKIHAPGTIIGKALEPLEKGQGEIQVLLSLQ